MGIFSDITHYLRVFRLYIGRRLYIVFGLTVLVALAEGFGIALLLPLLGAVEAGEGTVDGGLQRVLHDVLHWVGIGDSVVGILLFIGAAFVSKGLLKFAEQGYNGYLQAHLMRELKGRMFDAYSTMDYRYYIQRNTGHFINVINTQVHGFYRSFKHFSGFLSNGIMTFSYFAIAFLIAWRFALMAVMIGLVLLLLFKYLNTYVRSLSRRASEEYSVLNKLLVQVLQGFEYVASTNQVQALRQGVVDSIRRYTGYRLRQKMAAALTDAVREPLSVLFLIVVITIQLTVFNDPIAPIFVALILFHRGMQSTISLQGAWQKIMDEIGSLEMVHGEFADLRRHRECDGVREIDHPLSDNIAFRGVSFAYNRGEDEVLKDLNLTIPANTTVTFVGESGAGKSTLIRMLTLMLRPTEGEIYIDGVPASNVKLGSWRSQIGYVSQETVVFDDTIANNICLWAGDAESDTVVRSRVEEAARKAYAHHFINELPDGYRTVVGDRGVRLSGGQRQRLFIARELYKKPSLLILDEATSALDTESERNIQESIDSLKGSVTVVIIAHRLSTIKNVDYVYVLDHGRIVENGTYAGLTTNGQTHFRQMVEMQTL